MFSYTTIILVLSFEYVLCEYHCYYLDKFEKRKYIVCDSGCCGDVHLAYCCHRYLTAIILGSAGFVLVLVVIAISVHIYYRRCRRQGRSEFAVDTRNYGALDNSGNTETDNQQYLERPPDEHISQEVEHDVGSVQHEVQRSRELRF